MLYNLLKVEELEFLGLYIASFYIVSLEHILMIGHVGSDHREGCRL